MLTYIICDQYAHTLTPHIQVYNWQQTDQMYKKETGKLGMLWRGLRCTRCCPAWHILSGHSRSYLCSFSWLCSSTWCIYQRLACFFWSKFFCNSWSKTGTGSLGTVHAKTLFEIAMALLTISVSFPSKLRFSATFSILLRFGESWNPTNCEKFNADGSWWEGRIW